MLSAIVLTKNVASTIHSCLKSIKFTDEIIVIDDFSSDRTFKIAKKFTPKVFQRKLAANFASQRNFGLKKAKGEWVLFIDSDELVSRDLKSEIEEELKKVKPEIKGFYLKRQDKFLRKWLKYGETANLKFLRLARKNSGQWQGKVHEVWNVKGKTGELKNSLLHNHSIPISKFLKRIDFYSSLRAQELYQEKVKEGLWKIFVFPVGKFFINYFVKLGFLDRLPGLIMACLMSWHSLLVRLKLRLLWSNYDKRQFKLPKDF